MHALDALDIEAGGGEVGSRLGGRLSSLFGEGVNLDEGGDTGQARGAGIAALRSDPVDVARGEVGARLDAAMTFLDGGLGGDLGGGAVGK